MVLMNCLCTVSGGAMSYIRNMAPLLSNRFHNSPDGHRLKFLAHENQRELLRTIDEPKIIWITGQRPNGYHRVLWEYMNMPRIVRGEGVDILFTPYQIGPPVRDSKRVLILRNMEPYFFQGYHYSPRTWVRNRLLSWQSSRCLRRADRVIAVSAFAKDHLISRINIEVERIRTVSHGRPNLGSSTLEVNDVDALSRLGIKGDFILTCGSVLPYRRCEDVIAAFNQCAALDQRIQLIIAGSGTDRRYGELIRRAVTSSPYRDRILAAGQVPWKTMAALYRRCLLFVTATEIEACPNIAIEAMAAGCVIVSSDRPPLPEIFHGASLQYPARDIGHLVQQMRRCIYDEDLRAEMKMRALKRAEVFSWEKCARETYAALTEW
jgi:glycosyltransferase involved in cell wall biosynthesis